MTCQAAIAAAAPPLRTDPQDQLSRLMSVYSGVGLSARDARLAASSDLAALHQTRPMDPMGPDGKPPRWLILSAFAAIYLIWGSTFLAIRYAVATVPPFLMAGGRFVVAGLLLFGLARWRGARVPTARQWRDAIIVGACMLVVGNGGVTWAEVVIPSGVAALIIALIPLWMVIFDWLGPGGVRPKPIVFCGLAAGFAGVGLLALGHSAGVSDTRGWGIAALVFASMSWAAGSLFNRRARKPSSPLMTVAIQMIAGGGLMVVLGMALGEGARFSLDRITAISGAAWLYLSLVGSLIGYTAYVWLLEVSTPARVSTYAYVNPLIAVALGCTLGQERFSQSLFLAAGMIVAAVGLIVTGGAERLPLPSKRGI